MKTLNQYKDICTNAIFQYLQNKDLDTLIEKFKSFENIEFEKNHYYNSEKKLWFKFHKNDTLITSIRDIELDLNLPPSHSNHKFLIKNFKYVCDENEKDFELQVYYS